MKKLVNQMLEQKVWAVVGATPNTEKFGNKIYNTLKQNGYKVVGINPRYEKLDGDTLYPTLAEAMEKENIKIDCVSVVVPPSISDKVLENADKLNIPYIWFQPHTYDNEWIENVKVNNIKMVYNHCVLVEIAAGK